MKKPITMNTLFMATSDFHFSEPRAGVLQLSQIHMYASV